MEKINISNSSLEHNRVSAKPDWLRVKAPNSSAFNETRKLMRTHKLNTVCEEAACPNIGECWQKSHATVMILGSVCTRACAFCNVKTGRPDQVNLNEPEELARAASKLNLSHIVITSVDRDDLLDGGASQFVKCILRLQKSSPGMTIEVLTPDFRNKTGALEQVVTAKPDVFNHNLETVPRLYSRVRPGARYYHSLKLLDRVKQLDPHIFTKSGIMVGLGEERGEIFQVMDDLRSADVDFITIGQYLQPTQKHHEIIRYVPPDEFKEYERLAYAKGFLMVSATPLTRSSYFAGDDFIKLRARRQSALESSKNRL